MNIPRRVLATLLIFTLAASAVFTQTSCKRTRKYKKAPVHTDFTYDDFAEQMQTLLPTADSIAKADSMNVAYMLKYVYLHNDYDPIWLSHGYRPDTVAVRFLEELEDLRFDGLDTSVFKIDSLRSMAKRLKRPDASMEDAIAFDTAMTKTYMNAAKTLLLGRLNPAKADSNWHHANDSTWKITSILTGLQAKYIGMDSFRSTLPTYAALKADYTKYLLLSFDSSYLQNLSYLKDSGYDKEVIKTLLSAELGDVSLPDSLSEFNALLVAYQRYNGLSISGTLDSATLATINMPLEKKQLRAAANMERIRWMQRDMGNLYIIVDIPLMELFLRKDGEDAMHMNVVVGKPVRQTPSIYAKMTNVVINPPWGVPPTILKKDVLPGMMKSGGAYLAKKGLKAYDQKGNPVSANNITEKNYKRYIYKQAPGDDNALGYVKFNLPNKWDIYLHDTPHRTDFGKKDRALSSGCVRLSKPKELALYILADLEQKKFDSEKLEKIIKTHKTQWQILSNKIPVHIVYITAFEDENNSSQIRYLKDIYGRDAKLIKLLSAA